MERAFQRRAAETTGATDRVALRLIQDTTIVRLGEHPNDAFDLRSGGEVEQRLRDRGRRQAPVMDDHELAARMHFNSRQSRTSARRRHLDGGRGMVEQPVPPQRGRVREHRAGTRVEDRGHQVGLHRFGDMADGVDAGKDLAEVTLAYPTSEPGIGYAQLAQLPPAHSSPLEVGDTHQLGADDVDSVPPLGTASPSNTHGRSVDPIRVTDQGAEVSNYRGMFPCLRRGPISRLV